MTHFSVRTQDDGVAVVTSTGLTTTTTASDLKAMIARTLHGGMLFIVIDLSDIHTGDSSFLRVLVGGVKAARIAGGDLRIASLTPQMIALMKASTLDRILRMYPRVEDAYAVASLRADPYTARAGVAPR